MTVCYKALGHTARATIAHGKRPRPIPPGYAASPLPPTPHAPRKNPLASAETVNYIHFVLVFNSTKPATPPPAPQGGVAHARLHRAIEALILALLAGLLGRHARLARAWHRAPAFIPAAAPAPISPDVPVLRLPTDGTHLVIESPILYVIGPGPNRGMRPRPRATPVAPRRGARAPPAAPPSPIPNPSHLPPN